MRTPKNFLFYLSAHEGCTKRLLVRAKDLTADDIEISADTDIVRIRKMVNSVRMEIHRMKGFVRLNPLGEQVLYGYLRPRHRIGDHIAEHLARRNPGTIVVLGNPNESWVSLFIDGKIINRHEGEISRTLEEIKSAANCPSLSREASEKSIEEVWEAYYASQHCPERRNISAFHRRMPRKALDSAGLRLEKNKNGTTLDDFFGKDC